MSTLVRLYGTPLSNYYNKVKIALLEQGRPFDEVSVMPADRWPDAGSPTGKIPYLETPDGDFIYESQAIVEYLEDTRSDAPSLYPRAPYARACCRELVQYLELYLEHPVRPLYAAAYWGAPPTPGLADQVIQEASKGLLYLARRARFSPWLCGETFTIADATAWAHLNTVQGALTFFGAGSLMADAIPQLPDYLKHLASRPSIQKAKDDMRVEFRKKSGKA